MEDGTYGDSKPWSEEDNIAMQFYVMVYSYLELFGCWLASLGDASNCGW
jgi:hypothetical protein